MVTFNSVLEGINKHSQCTPRRLVGITIELFMLATSMSTTLGSLLIKAFTGANSTVYIWLLVLFYLVVFGTLDCIAKSEEVYRAVIQWGKFLVVLTILLFAFSGVILFLF